MLRHCTQAKGRMPTGSADIRTIQEIRSSNTSPLYFNYSNELREAYRVRGMMKR